MAKFLRRGENLFTLDGTKSVDQVQFAPDAVAYNLLVDDFHTYVVGKSRLLVHDNTIPKSTTTVVPGIKQFVDATP